jgi:hypothetical protein
VYARQLVVALLVPSGSWVIGRALG